MLRLCPPSSRVANAVPAVLALVVAFVIAGGCGSLSQPYPQKGLYALEVPRRSPAFPETARPTTLPAKVRGGLLVRGVRISQPFDANTFTYKIGPSRFTSDYYNGFVAPPARLLTGIVVERLGADGLFDNVTDGSSALGARYSLETVVTRLYGDYTDPRSPAAVIEACIVLLEEDARGARLRLNRSYRELEPAHGPEPEHLASAWGRACGRVLDQLEVDLQGVQFEPPIDIASPPASRPSVAAGRGNPSPSSP